MKTVNANTYNRIASVSMPATLAQAILQSKTTRLANIYFVARYYDTEGAGFSTLNDCRNLFRVAKRSALLASNIRRDPAFYTYFRAYDEKTGRLYYRDLAAVAALLGVHTLDNSIVSFDIVKASRSLAIFSATVYAVALSIFTGPVSRDTITSYTGASKSAQHKWEKAIRINKQFVFLNGTPEELAPFIRFNADGSPIASKGLLPGTIQIQSANIYNPGTASTVASVFNKKKSSKTIKKLNNKMRNLRFSNSLSIKEGQGTFDAAKDYATDLLSNKPSRSKTFFSEDQYFNRKQLPSIAFVNYSDEPTNANGHLAFFCNSSSAMPVNIALRSALQECL